MAVGSQVREPALIERLNAANHLIVVKDVRWWGCWRTLHQRGGRAVVRELHHHDSDRIEAYLSRIGSPRNLSDLGNRPLGIPRLFVRRHSRGSIRQTAWVSRRAHECHRQINHGKSCRDGEVRRSVNGQMTRIELVMEPWQRLGVFRHRCLGFHRQVDGAHRDSPQGRIGVESSPLIVTQINPIVLTQILKRPWSSTSQLPSPHSAYDQVQILLLGGTKILHSVIDAETDRPRLDVTAKQRATSHQVEKRCPTRNLRVPITPGMVLPSVAESVRLLRTVAERSNENVCASHAYNLAGGSATHDAVRCG